MIKLDNKNIYDSVMIVYNVKNNVYCVVNIQDINNGFTIWSGKDLETAMAVRKAYCDGYYDRKREENNDD